MHYVKNLIPFVLFCGNVKGSNRNNHSARPMNSKSKHVLRSTRYAVWWSYFTPPSYYSISQRTTAKSGNLSVRPRSYAAPPDRLPNNYPGPHTVILNHLPITVISLDHMALIPQVILYCQAVPHHLVVLYTQVMNHWTHLMILVSTTVNWCSFWGL